MSDDPQGRDPPRNDPGHEHRCLGCGKPLPCVKLSKWDPCRLPATTDGLCPECAEREHQN